MSAQKKIELIRIFENMAGREKTTNLFPAFMSLPLLHFLYFSAQLDNLIMEPPDERTTLIQKLSNGNKRAARFSILCFYTLLFFSSIWFLNYLKSSNEGSKPDFSHLHHSILCPGLEPIGVEEFGARRMSLGNLLSEGNNKWGVYLSEPS